MAQGVTVVDDFAHHPTAIRETLQGLRGRFGSGRLIAVFEPRSATSRTAVFQNEFAGGTRRCRRDTDRRCPHAGKRHRREIGSTSNFGRRHSQAWRPCARVAEDRADTDSLAQRASAGDTVVIMSSGSFDNLHDRLLQNSAMRCSRLGPPTFRK